MSRLENMKPLGWAETILFRVESVQKDLTKLARDVAELRSEMRRLREAWEGAQSGPRSPSVSKSKQPS
jgi:hypothetical protein